MRKSEKYNDPERKNAGNSFFDFLLATDETGRVKQQLAWSRKWSDIICLAVESFTGDGFDGKPLIVTSIALQLRRAEDDVLKQDASQSLDDRLRNLFLLSGAYRTIATNSSLDPTYKDYCKKRATDHIRQAVEILDTNPIVRDDTRAKVYFHAGAAFHDISNDRKTAHKFYIKASELFVKESPYYYRTAVRDLRCLIEDNRNKEAYEMLSKFTIGSKMKTEAVQLAYMKSKVLLLNGGYVKAFKCAMHAHEVAAEKYMITEAEMLKEIMHIIKHEALINGSIADKLFICWQVNKTTPGFFIECALTAASTGIAVLSYMGNRSINHLCSTRFMVSPEYAPVILTSAAIVVGIYFCNNAYKNVSEQIFTR